MTLDRSLKVGGGLARSRSVLSRAERIEKLIEEGVFDPKTRSPFGLPKVKVKHSKAGTKAKKEEKAAEGAEGAEAAPGAAPAAGGKAAPAGKAPAAGKAAAGAKGAAPAAAAKAPAKGAKGGK